MQDWSEVRKRILKLSESDSFSDVISISYQVKTIIETSFVPTIQVVLTASHPLKIHFKGRQASNPSADMEGPGRPRSGAAGRDTPCPAGTAPLIVDDCQLSLEIKKSGQ